MTVKKKEAVKAQDEKLEEDTVNGHVDTSALDGMSKTNAMSVVMKGMAAADPNKWVEMMNAVLAQVGNYSKSVPDGAAEKNKASTAAKGAIASAVKEDLATIFGDNQELSEDFKEKASTLLESAVNARVALVEAELQEAYEQAIEEEVEAIYESMIDTIDTFLSDAVKKWAADNIVAIERSVSAELAEEFIVGLGQLFREHNFNIPADKVEVVDMLADKLDETETALNQSLIEGIEKDKKIDELTKGNVLSVMSEGLTDIEADKFKTLTEGFEIDGDLDGFVKKLETIKNHHFNKSTPKSKTQLISEEVTYTEEQVAEEKKAEEASTVPANMKRYVDALSQTRRAW